MDEVEERERKTSMHPRHASYAWSRRKGKDELRIWAHLLASVASAQGAAMGRAWPRYWASAGSHRTAFMHQDYRVTFTWRR